MPSPEFEGNNINEHAAAEFIADRVESWDFSEHTDAENIWFTYHVARWVSDAFDPYVQFNSREIDGAEIPDSIQLLLVPQYSDETSYTDENTISVLKEPVYTYVPPVIPRWDEIKKLETFDEWIKMAANDPEIHENIRVPIIDVDDMVVITFKPAFYHYWGLEFQVNRRDIKISAFGDSGKTRAATDYVVGYSEKYRVLSKTVCELAVLAAKNCQRARVPVLREGIFESFDFRLLQVEVPELFVDDKYQAPPGNSLSELLIKTLYRLGKITLENQPDFPDD